MTPFSTITSGAVAMFATHKYFEYAYPRKTVDFDNYVKWQTVRIYTLAEMATRGVRKSATSKLSSSFGTIFPSYVETECIILSSEGNTEIYKALSDIPKDKYAQDYDLVMYKQETPPADEKHDFNMLRYGQVSDVSQDFDTSLVKLLAIQLKVEGEEAVPLDFGRRNFYIVGNVLFDKPFLKWMLMEGGNVDARKMLETGKPYKVEFINQNMSCDSVDDERCIIIGEEDYQVVEYASVAGTGNSSKSGSRWNLLDRLTKD